jgi:VIT1/CCC1 family predicted Fe2+/Mn2+ transporter
MKKLLTNVALSATLLSAAAIEPVEAKSYFQEQYQSAAITQVVPSSSLKLGQYASEQRPANTDEVNEEVGAVILLVLFLIISLYFLPTVVAFSSNSRLAPAVLVVNLFLGWTGLGWIGALVMAVLPSRKETNIIVQQSADGSNGTIAQKEVSKATS